MIKHWLYGEVELKHEVTEEIHCTKCIHKKVCNYAMSFRCLNFRFSTSVGTSDSCDQCLHRFTRFDKEPIPCFICGDFLEE